MQPFAQPDDLWMPPVGGSTISNGVSSGAATEHDKTEPMLSNERKCITEAWRVLSKYISDNVEDMLLSCEDDDKWMFLIDESLSETRQPSQAIKTQLLSKEDHLWFHDVVAEWINVRGFTDVVEILVAKYMSSFGAQGADAVENLKRALLPLHEALCDCKPLMDKVHGDYRSRLRASEVFESVIFGRLWKWYRVLPYYAQHMLRTHRADMILKPPPVERQHELIDELLDRPAEEGEFRCALSKTWLREYRSYAQRASQQVEEEDDLYGETAPQGSSCKYIDTLEHCILDNDLRCAVFADTYDNLTRFVFVRPEVYESFMEWFGGGPAIKVYMKQRSYYDRTIVPQLKPYSVTFTFTPEALLVPPAASSGTRDEQVSVRFWGHRPLREALVAAIDLLTGDRRQVARERLASGTLEAFKGSYIYSEDEPADLDKALCTSSDYEVVTFTVKRALLPGESRYVPGHCGLSNLGNTCYMNSALQCISNCADFRATLCSLPNLDASVHPVTVALRDVLKKMWSGKVSVVRPTALKEAFGLKCRRFQGYEQQDSIEFVQALLDVVHEELNPVKKKKYRERLDSDMQIPEAQLATIFWEDYCENNKSIVADYFHGQLKSRLECLTCGRISVVFDGISCLPVNIDKHELHSYDIPLLFAEAEPAPRQLRIRIRLPLAAPVSMLVAEIKQWMAENQHDPAELVVIKANPYRPDDAFLDPVALIAKDDQFAAFVLPSHKPVHEDREMRAKKAEEERVAKEKAAEEKRKRDKELGANKKAKVSDSDTVPMGPVMGSAEGTDPHVPSVAPDAVEAMGTLAVAQEPVFNTILVGVESVTRRRDPFRNIPVRVPIFVRSDATADTILQRVEEIAMRFLRRKSAAPRHHDAAASTDAVATSSEPPLAAAVELGVDEAQLAQSTDAPRKRELIVEETYGYNHRAPVIPGNKDPWFNAEAHQATMCAYFDPAVWQLVEAPTEDDETMSKVPPNRHKRAAVSLEKCLSVKSTLLTGTDQWYCPRCKEHRDAKKDERIYRLPRVCIIQFKRFQMCPSTFMMRKLETQVTFPERLDFTPYAADNGSHYSTKFALAGVVHHSGSLAFGHYTATAHCGDTWVDYNDGHVSPLHGDARPHHTHAYLLFYSAMPHSTIITPRKVDDEDDEDIVPAAAAVASRKERATSAEWSAEDVEDREQVGPLKAAKKNTSIADLDTLD